MFNFSLKLQNHFILCIHSHSEDKNIFLSWLSDKLNDFTILMYTLKADLHQADDTLNQPLSGSRVIQLNDATTKSMELLFELL